MFPKPSKTKRGNTVRKISKETKEYIIERDQVCIICEYSYIETVHHSFFGDQAMYGKDRNDPEYLVGLCNQCHTLLHFDGNSNHYREECIQYLKNYYENNPKR